MTDKKTTGFRDQDRRSDVVIRRLTGSDSLEALTELIRRAYAPLGQRNLRYLAAVQTEDVTRRRIGDGECWIAELDGRIVGTILLHLPRDSGKGWYGRHLAAKFCQFAVDPQTQGLGLGSLLLDTIERRAVEAGALEMSCDTAVQAKHLIRMYMKRGYHCIDYTSWANTNYYSVMMTKSLKSITHRDKHAIQPMGAIRSWMRFVRCRLVMGKDGKKRLWIRAVRKLASTVRKRA